MTSQLLQRIDANLRMMTAKFVLLVDQDLLSQGKENPGLDECLKLSIVVVETATPRQPGPD